VTGFGYNCWFELGQIMAMGTLAMCYNNIQVFRGVVKIRSGKCLAPNTASYCTRACVTASLSENSSMLPCLAEVELHLASKSLKSINRCAKVEDSNLTQL